jgi:hypothetical protein
MKYQTFKVMLPLSAFFCFVILSTSVRAIGVKNLDGFEALFGRYAPQGDCTRQPRIMVDKKGFTFEVGAQVETATNPEYAASYGGNFYEGISLWFFPYFDPNKERPLLLTFNAGEQKGVLTVDTEYNYPGGPKLDAKYQALVDGSPYKICR